MGRRRLWMAPYQKSTILLISGTVSVGGCGGQECYNKPNPRVISQMLSSWEHAESHKQFLNSSEDGKEKASS